MSWDRTEPDFEPEDALKRAEAAYQRTRNSPSDSNAEDRAVAGLLAFPDLILDAAETLRPAWFQNRNARRLFSALHGMAADGVIVDRELADGYEGHTRSATWDGLLDRLDQDGKETREFWGGYLDSLRDLCGAKEDADAAVQDVATRWYRRRCATELLGALNKIADTARTPEQVDGALSRMGSGIAGLTRLEGEGEALEGSAIIRAAIAHTENAPTAPRFDTGLPIDACLGGFHRTELTIIAATPGGGKTALMLQIARRAARVAEIERLGSVLFFSSEMEAAELGLRCAAAEASLDLGRLTDGRLNAEERGRLADVEEFYSTLPLVLDQPAEFTVERIGLELQRKSLRGRVAMVVVDYLQELQDVAQGRSAGRTERLAEAVIKLKGLATRYRCPIITGSQITRDGQDRSEPELRDLADTSQCERSAGKVLFLHKPEQGEPGVLLLLKKHRNGRVGRAETTFNGPMQRFGPGNEIDPNLELDAILRARRESDDQLTPFTPR